MFKKLLSVILLSLMLVSLVACGNESSEPANINDNEEGQDIVENNNETESEDIDEKDEGSKDIYFKDNEVKSEDLKIKIKETKVIPVGEVGNEYGEKPVLAIWYEVTNLSDKDINPTTAWFAIFNVIQDNNPNAINELEVGMLPDSDHSSSQIETIKENGTVENSVAYGLDDLETPVELIASQGIMGDEIGRMEIDIK